MENVKAGMIKSYLAMICYAQISLGLRDMRICNMACLEYIIRGDKRCMDQKTHTRIPITPPIMRVSRSYWMIRIMEYDAIMLWVVACMFFLAL